MGIDGPGPMGSRQPQVGPVKKIDPLKPLKPVAKGFEPKYEDEVERCKKARAKGQGGQQGGQHGGQHGGEHGGEHGKGPTMPRQPTTHPKAPELHTGSKVNLENLRVPDLPPAEPASLPPEAWDELSPSQRMVDDFLGRGTGERAGIRPRVSRSSLIL